MAIFFHLILFQMITGSLASTMSISFGFLLIFLICFHTLSSLISWVLLCMPLMTQILFMVCSGKSVGLVAFNILNTLKTSIYFNTSELLSKKEKLHFFFLLLLFFLVSLLNSNFRLSLNHTCDNITLPHYQLQPHTLLWPCPSQHLV